MTYRWSTVGDGGGAGGRPEAREMAAAAAVKGTLYVFGGYGATAGDGRVLGDLWMLDPGLGTWSELACPPEAAPSPRFGATMVAVDAVLVVFGGCGPRNVLYGDVHIFDTRTQLWSRLASSGAGPSPRWGCGGAALGSGERVVIFGGLGGDGYSNEVFALEPQTGAWEVVGTSGAPSPRAHAVVAMWSGGSERVPCLVVHGGYSSSEGVLGDTCVLNLATGHWRMVEVSAEARYGHVGVLIGSTLMVHGGLSAARRSPVALLSNAVALNLEAPSAGWVPASGEDEDAAGIGRAFAVSAAVDSTGYVFGGYTARDVLSAETLSVRLPPPPLVTLGLASLTAAGAASAAVAVASSGGSGGRGSAAGAKPAVVSSTVVLKCKFKGAFKLLRIERTDPFTKLQTQMDEAYKTAVYLSWQRADGTLIDVINADDFAYMLDEHASKKKIDLIVQCASGSGSGTSGGAVPGTPDSLVPGHAGFPRVSSQPTMGGSSGSPRASVPASVPASGLNASMPVMGATTRGQKLGVRSTAAMRMSQQGRPTYGPSGTIHWQKRELLGSGAFGKVYLGMNEATAELMAVKQVVLDNISESNQEELLEVEGEIAILQELSHKHIVRYIATERATNEDGQAVLNIFLEYVPGGSLAKLIHKYPVSERVTRSYLKQVLLGLEYLHENGIVHRDIKCANILIAPAQQTIIKLTDFGADDVVGGAALVQGHAVFMAPEVVLQQPYNSRCDIWSVGCVAIELLTGRPPWSEFSPVTALFKIGKSNDSPKYPEGLSAAGIDFLNLCFRRDPNQRPSAADLLQHPWIASVDEVAVPSPTPAMGGGPSAMGASATPSPTGMATMGMNPMQSVGGMNPMQSVGGGGYPGHHGGAPSGYPGAGGMHGGVSVAGPPPASSALPGYHPGFSPQTTPTSSYTPANGFAAGFAGASPTAGTANHAVGPGGVALGQQPAFSSPADVYSLALSEPEHLSPEAFWERYFGVQAQAVLMPNFLSALQAYLGLSLTAEQQGYLNELFNPRGLGQLTLDSLKYALQWFGPLHESVRICTELMSNLWFHGFINKDQTARVLTNAAPGEFLVRVSESTSGGFVVAYIDSRGAVIQSKLYSAPGRGYTGDQGHTFYDSLPALIQAYSAKLRMGKPRMSSDTSGYTQLSI
ncbi:STE/STE11 protein kinase [Thecamonas trahens ATCC 50062]|uniref:STE/STE11 protein kinase n=1 Tax=Thecamonas trahens ATCC 50062 TaxID=461836 RepID=A0A0L0DC02_THETB|nr:STE/STE11 protein kinase [Thecamonas trahens ATCC 50062]KNC49879.1 STE/STE11 protein kinase [Thecamonas trahens ATCC 50062]|eukprot:XP_013757363.1 STE/STE11 protein kinase [Thecamonas trahens ATCC 50062]